MGSRPECLEMFERISEYIDGEMSPEMNRSFEEHCARCEPCQNFIATFRRSVEISRQAGDCVPSTSLFLPKEVDKLRELFERECAKLER